MWRWIIRVFYRNSELLWHRNLGSFLLIWRSVRAVGGGEANRAIVSALEIESFSLEMREYLGKGLLDNQVHFFSEILFLVAFNLS